MTKIQNSKGKSVIQSPKLKMKIKNDDAGKRKAKSGKRII
jgi:hypothetical protein